MKVSIIIPCYNSEKYIHKCMDSVINQTYTNWEVIVVDDGSSDNSYKILKEYSLKNNKIKIIRQKNYGPSIARNIAMNYVNGEYIMFIDIDDYVEKNILEEFTKYAKCEGSDIITCGYYEVKSNKVTAVNNFESYNNIDKRYFFLEKILLTSGGVIWGKMYKTEIIKKNNILFDPNIRISEDQLFNIEVLLKSSTLSYSNKNLYYYNLDNNFSITKNNTFNNIDNQILIQNTLENKLKKLNFYEKNIKKLLAKRLYYNIYNFIYFYVYENIDSLNKIKEIVNKIEISKYLEEIILKDTYDKMIYFLLIKKRIKCLYIALKIRIFVAKLIKRLNRRWKNVS